MRLLLVEDDQNLSDAIAEQLQKEGYITDCCYDGETALHYALNPEYGYDIVLLDRMLPIIDGLTVLKAMRQKQIFTPVLILTGLGELEDKIEGLDCGADDYLVKPFAFEELMARIRCVTRRSPILTPSDPSKVCLEDLTLFIEEKRLMGPAGQCTLSQREAVLTEVLLRAGLNTPMPRTTLLLKVWGPDNDIEDGNLDNYIHFLRRRFRQLESTLQIKTLRGTGYCLTTADERN